MKRVGTNVGPERAALALAIFSCPECYNVDGYEDLIQKIVSVRWLDARSRFEMKTVGLCRGCKRAMIWETGFLGARARRKN